MFLGLLTAAALAGTVDLPMRDRPTTLQSDDLDRFYIDYGEKLVRWTTVQDRVYDYAPPKRWNLNWIEHRVAPPDGTVHTLRQVSRRDCTDKECSSWTDLYQLDLIRCPATGPCAENQLASWSIGKDEKYPTTFAAEHRVTELGTPLVKLVKTVRSSEGSRSIVSCTCGGAPCEEPEYQERRFSEMKAPPTYRIDERKKAFYGGALGGAAPKLTLADGVIDAMANVDTGFLYDRKGRAHIYLHTASRKFAHLYVDESTGTPDPKGRTVVDGPESGAANAVVRYGPQGALVFHYFYRNSYYKGVKATFYDDAMAAPVWQVDLDNSRDENPGWQLLAASTPQGRLLVSYLDDPIGKKVTNLRLYDNAQSIFDAQAEQPTGWERNHKIWFGRVGAGPGLALWTFSAGGPDPEDLVGADAGARMEATYGAPPSIMIGGTVEAKFGGMSFGASYARNQLQSAATSLTEQTENPVYERLFGQIGIDRIIKYHDIRLALRLGVVDLNYAIAPTVDGTAPIPDDRTATGVRSSMYRRLDIYFLNTWRVRYGFFQQTYEAVLPFYVWAIDAGQTSYRFVDSFQSGATFQDYGLTVGYSRIDYAAKFENKVTAPFVDADAGLGVSTAQFDAPVTIAEGEPVDDAFAIMVPFNVEVGGMVLRRSHKLRGLGWYGRVFYRTEGSWSGTSAKPADKEEAAEEASVRVGYDRLEVRHGPFLDVGLVF